MNGRFEGFIPARAEAQPPGTVFPATQLDQQPIRRSGSAEPVVLRDDLETISLIILVEHLTKKDADDPIARDARQVLLLISFSRCWSFFVPALPRAPP